MEGVEFRGCINNVPFYMLFVLLLRYHCWCSSNAGTAIKLFYDSFQEFCVGRIKKYSSFTDYVRKALINLNVDSGHCLSESRINSYYEEFLPRRAQLQRFIQVTLSLLFLQCYNAFNKWMVQCLPST